MELKDSRAIAKLLEILGGVVIASILPADALIYFQTGTLPLRVLVASMIVGSGGVLFLLAGLFFHRLEPHLDSRITDKLATWASTPTTYALVLLIAWIYFASVSMLEIIQTNARITALQKDQLSVNRVIDCFVVPRRLTENQIVSIANLLMRYDAQQVVFETAKNDEEAALYRNDLQRALEKGGWHTKAINECDKCTFGLSDAYYKTLEHQHQNVQSDFNHPDAERVLRMAFGMFGVALDGTGGSGTTLGDTNKLAEDTVVVSIGTRRRDSYACAPKQPL